MTSAIREIIMSAPDMGGHYTGKKVMMKTDEDIVLMFILGARRIGKTLFFQYVMCKLFIEYGLQTMWLRNKKIEFDGADFRANFLNACKRLGWCPDEWVVTREGVMTSSDKETAQLVCLFEGVSTFSNRRGNESAGVHMIVLDEMMPEDRRYPPRAHTGLMSLTKTVLSGKPGSMAFCLSNFVASGNPYFSGYRVYPERDKDVTVFPEKGIAIEVCRGYRCAIDDSSPWTKVYAAGGYSDYSDADEDKLFQLIRKVPKGAKPLDIVLLVGSNRYRLFSKSSLVYAGRDRVKVADTLVYTPDLENTGTDAFLMPRWLLRNLQYLTMNNMIRFEDVNAMYDVLSIVYQEV